MDLDDMDSDDENMFAQPVEESKQGEAEGSVGIMKVRKYDLSITYDFYT
jgi:ubiquitin-like-conjugating enzyme ATG3